MIRIEDLQEAIAECEGIRNPNASTCIKLASFYTILNQMQGKDEQPEAVPRYSYAAEPERKPDTIRYTSETEFGGAVHGKDPAEVMAIMDELMTTLQVMIPRLYEGVLRKIQT